LRCHRIVTLYIVSLICSTGQNDELFERAMLASLPMYDLAEIREATDAFWSAVAQIYGVKGELTREADWTAAWRTSDLLLSQTCGYPFTHDFKDVLTYVATPHYNADGCNGPHYCSVVYARQAAPLDTFRNKVAAFNTRDSMSGMLALQLVFSPLATQGRFFDRAVETGGHFASLQAVQAGEADVCAVDCVTVAYARRYRPSALEGVCEVARSPAVPALPYVTRSGDAAGLYQALHETVRDRRYKDVCDTLLLNDVSRLSATHYDIILSKETEMRQSGGLLLW
jgi:ABC-type phosphate/phosphonate transport system substrate-binding protein